MLATDEYATKTVVLVKVFMLIVSVTKEPKAKSVLS